MDCIFCSIVDKQIPADIVFESEDVLAFRDIHPKAPTHILVIPKVHVGDLSDLSGNQELTSAYWKGVLRTAEALGVLGNVKIQINSGKEAGQEVPHLHTHILSEKKTVQN